MAGAWAVEANGKPKAAADNKEIKSLFMDANVLKINGGIVALLVGINDQIHRRARARAVVRPVRRLETEGPCSRFASM